MPGLDWRTKRPGRGGAERPAGGVVAWPTGAGPVTIGQPIAPISLGHVPLTFQMLMDALGGIHPLAEVDLNDPVEYYGGFKFPYVVRYDPVTRGLSDHTGRLEHAACGATYADEARYFRAILGDAQLQFLLNHPITEWMIDDEDRRRLLPASLIFNGFVNAYSPLSEFQFKLTASDWILANFSSQPRGQYAWQPIVTLTDFPNAGSTITTASGAIVSVDAVNKAIPVPYGVIAGTYGMHIPVYVGKRTIGAHDYHRWVVAAGAISSIDAVYIYGQAITISSTDWLIPGQTQYAAVLGPNLFSDINGRRYTEMYGLVGATDPDVAAGLVANPHDYSAFHPELSSQVAIALDIKGYETKGDATGVLIRGIADQAAHFSVNFLPQNPTYGAPTVSAPAGWRTVSPNFAIVASVPVVDLRSFSAVQAETERRIPGGYEGAIVLGANGEAVTVEDALARFAVSGDFELGDNAYGSLVATIEPLRPPSIAPEIDDVLHLKAGSFDIAGDESPGSFWNVTPYVHTQDYTGRTQSGWLSTAAGDVEVRDDGSISKYGEQRGTQVQLFALRNTTDQGASTIADVLKRIRLRYRNPRSRVTGEVPVSVAVADTGGTMRISTAEGIGSNGWVRRWSRVQRLQIDPATDLIRFEGYDLQPIFDGLAA